MQPEPHARRRPGSYVDLDPVTVDVGRNLLTGSPHALVTGADLREPGQIRDHPQVREFLDCAEPVAVLTVAVWHFIPDTAEPAAAVLRTADIPATGSYLVLSHPAPLRRSGGRPP